VLDFGLAKRTPRRDAPHTIPGLSESPTELSIVSILTNPGSTIGTVAYMSTEQRARA